LGGLLVDLESLQVDKFVLLAVIVVVLVVQTLRSIVGAGRVSDVHLRKHGSLLVSAEHSAGHVTLPLEELLVELVAERAEVLRSLLMG